MPTDRSELCLGIYEAQDEISSEIFVERQDKAYAVSVDIYIYKAQMSVTHNRIDWRISPTIAWKAKKLSLELSIQCTV